MIDGNIEPYFDKDIHESILGKQKFQPETIDAKIRAKIAFLRN
jgi:hypothetical protein